MSILVHMVKIVSCMETMASLIMGLEDLVPALMEPTGRVHMALVALDAVNPVGGLMDLMGDPQVVILMGIMVEVVHLRPHLLVWLPRSPHLRNLRLRSPAHSPQDLQLLNHLRFQL